MAERGEAPFRSLAVMRRKAVKSAVGVSTEDVRRSAQNVRARGRGMPVRAREVMADMLSTRLVPFVKEGRVKVLPVDVPELRRRVGDVLTQDEEKTVGSVALLARFASALREVGQRRSRQQSAAETRGSLHEDVLAGVPVVTVAALSQEEDDVRDAVRNVYDRGGRVGEFGTAEVVAELIANRLAFQPSVIAVAIDAPELNEYAQQIEKILPSVQPDSPWRSALGPVYRAESVMSLLDGLSDAELEDARRRHAVLGLRTSDKHVVYPTFQFDGGKPILGLDRVLQVFPDEEDLVWEIASWLTVPLVILDDRSIVDVLRAGEIDAAEMAAQTIADRWGA